MKLDCPFEKFGIFEILPEKNVLNSFEINKVLKRLYHRVRNTSLGFKISSIWISKILPYIMKIRLKYAFMCNDQLNTKWKHCNSIEVLMLKITKINAKSITFYFVNSWYSNFNELEYDGWYIPFHIWIERQTKVKRGHFHQRMWASWPSMSYFSLFVQFYFCIKYWCL